MSRVYFHSPSEDVEILGSERSWAGRTANKVALGLLDLEQNAPWLIKCLEPRSYVEDAKSLALYLRSGMEDGLFWTPTESIGCWDLLLNTTMAAGSDPIRFLAKLHAQCEIHCWVNGSNRAWLANIIKDGLNTKICRAKQGWETVITFLEKTTSEPVVCSYSVCEQFPNAGVAEWSPPKEDSENWDLWYDLPREERWEKAFVKLREKPGQLEFNPDNFPHFFGTGLNAFDLIEMYRENPIIFESRK